MRIAHVVNDLRIGGTQHLLVRHVAELHKNYSDVENRVIVLGNNSDSATEYVDALGCRTVFLNFSGSYRRIRDSIRCMIRLHSTLKSFDPDLVHSYLWNANFFVGIATWWMRVIHVVHVVDRRGDRRASKITARAKVLLTGKVLRSGNTRFVAVSDACKEHVMAQWLIDRDRVIVAHNGIDVTGFDQDRSARQSGECSYLGVLSNFSSEKGHAVLFRALRILLDEGGRYRLLVAGSGTIEDTRRLQALVLSMEIADHVDFLGKVDDASNFYLRLDVFVVPSVSAEGLPTTILEAMASALPVLATRVGGAIEAITDGENGLLVEPDDAVALARSIQNIVGSPEQARRMGSAARRRVEEKFTTEQMTQNIVDSVYNPPSTRLANRTAAGI